LIEVMDAAEFERFTVGRLAALVRFARMVSADSADAEDLVQSALAGAYRHRHRLDAGGVESYVRRSVLNAQMTRRSRLLRRERPAADVRDAAAAEPSRAVDDRLWAVGVLRRLPPRQRAVLVLRYFYDLDEAAIAAELGISRGTVKSQASKALASLRAHEARLAEGASR
jgi:RNA polymerase sigma-70 factor (sigma-E family)